MEINGAWVGWGLGDWSHNPDGTDRDNTVRRAKDFMRRMYRSYAGGLADSNKFDQQMQDTVLEMQRRLVLDQKLTPGKYLPGVLDLPTQYAMGFKKPPPPKRPVCVSVEGHLSNMFFGPVADTFTRLEAEGLCRHQPTGYENGAIPFNNQDGVNALDENIRLRVPGDVDLVIGGFSQGMIVVHDYLEQHGIPPRLKGVLMYGNPNRKLGSVAPWARQWVRNPDTHGLDPYKRFGPDGVDLDAAGVPYADVWREGDIFAQNGEDQASQMKAAIYEIVARGNFTRGADSIIAEVAHTFGQPFSSAWAIFQAIAGGIGFIAKHPNPHYDPFDITGGVDWVRGLLKPR